MPATQLHKYLHKAFSSAKIGIEKWNFAITSGIPVIHSLCNLSEQLESVLAEEDVVLSGIDLADLKGKLIGQIETCTEMELNKLLEYSTTLKDFSRSMKHYCDYINQMCPSISKDILEEGLQNPLWPSLAQLLGWIFLIYRLYETELICINQCIAQIDLQKPPSLQSLKEQWCLKKHITVKVAEIYAHLEFLLLDNIS